MGVLKIIYDFIKLWKDKAAFRILCKKTARLLRPGEILKPIDLVRNNDIYRFLLKKRTIKLAKLTLGIKPKKITDEYFVFFSDRPVPIGKSSLILKIMIECNNFNNFKYLDRENIHYKFLNEKNLSIEVITLIAPYLNTEYAEYILSQCSPKLADKLIELIPNVQYPLENCIIRPKMIKYVLDRKLSDHKSLISAISNNITSILTVDGKYDKIFNCGLEFNFDLIFNSACEYPNYNLAKYLIKRKLITLPVNIGCYDNEIKHYLINYNDKIYKSYIIRNYENLFLYMKPRLIAKYIGDRDKHNIVKNYIKFHNKKRSAKKIISYF